MIRCVVCGEEYATYLELVRSEIQAGLSAPNMEQVFIAGMRGWAHRRHDPRDIVDALIEAR